MSTETELKILLDDAGLRALKRSAALSAMALCPPRRQSLHARYYDTDDGALGANRIALRVRREGRAWVQTVKAGHAPSAGLSSVREVSCPAPGGRLVLEALPDAELRAAIAAAARGGELAPRFETVMSRQLHRLASPCGGVVELAIDTGEIRAGERTTSLIEAELELAEGDPGDLYAVAERLFPDGPLRFSRRSKAARGAALAGGGTAVDPLPPVVHAAPIRLDPALTVEHAARDCLRGCLDQIAGNVPACLAHDGPEAPHQLRVGLRRLRTAFRLFRPVLDGPAMRALDAEARDLAVAVGALRDLDVLIDELAAPFAYTDPGFERMLAALEDRRREVRAAVRMRLAEGRTTRLILKLGAFTEARGWLRSDDIAQSAALAAPVTGFAAEAVDHRWRKAAKLGAVVEDLQGDARHDLRKALKKLRYALEFTESLWSRKALKPFLKALRHLQEAFGALQDLTMAQALLTGPDAPAADDPAAQRAVGILLGHRGAEAEWLWRRTRKDWKALRTTARPWR